MLLPICQFEWFQQVALGIYEFLEVFLCMLAKKFKDQTIWGPKKFKDRKIYQFSSASGKARCTNLQVNHELHEPTI